jgi:tRNA 5-methylaminomethyl-2-thiouridine biosynthesis bifunctional protein
LTDDVRISRFFSHSVNRLFKTETGWCATGKDVQDNAWQFEANAIVVCCAHSALSLAQFAHFPLTPVRGQISLLPATQASKALRAVVCGEVYCAPEESDTHVIGATHSFNNESLEVLSCDHLDNLSKLAEQIPALHETFGEIDINHLEGRASVRCSAPGAMPLVGEVQLGLYCSLAHGTRGLLTAGLSAEIIAAMLYGQLLPLPGSILNALAPIQRTRPK